MLRFYKSYGILYIIEEDIIILDIASVGSIQTGSTPVYTIYAMAGPDDMHYEIFKPL